MLNITTEHYRIKFENIKFWKLLNKVIHIHEKLRDYLLTQRALFFKKEFRLGIYKSALFISEDTFL